MRSSSSSGFMSRPPKLYGHVQANLHAGDLRIRLRRALGPRRHGHENARPGNRRHRQLAEVAPRQFHMRSFFSCLGSLPLAEQPPHARVSEVRVRRCNFTSPPLTGLSTVDFRLSDSEFRTAQYNPLMLLHRIRIALFFVAAAVAVGAAQINKSWPPGLQQVPEDSPPLVAGRGAQEVLHASRLSRRARRERAADPGPGHDRLGRRRAACGPSRCPATCPTSTRKGEHAPIGKIVVLEDTNHDGRMDKRTVFQDGLVLARWLKVLDRGVLVAEPPNLWLFQDTNGDLRADRKELVTDQYGRKEANVEHNANSLLWALDNNIYTSEIDIDLRLKNGKFDVRKTLSRGQWGITQDDAGRIFRNYERVGAARRSGSRALLHAPPEPAPHARQLRVAERAERRAERRVADPSDARRQPRVSVRDSASGWHAREIHVGVRADGVSRRSPAGRALRQRLRRRSDRQPRQPHHSERQRERSRPPTRRIATCAASFSPRPTSASARSICRSLPTARSTSSTCIAASSSTRDT